ncbi:NfeD family protein [Pararhizobium sp.]|uniref:NfeD family protein n=1 Tax=Pararhizobium sp. TaxID=1977563 RepID=UPI00272809CC|nr:NfeD family protein [Pararhizobium sp.]MDO9415188.1 NfeD family protein [Pararhizobium sp.]
MIARLVAELGPWTWLVVGLVLLGAEVLMPGVFLVWIGIAALITGAISLLLWDYAFWGWQPQVVIFAVLSVTAAILGRRFLLKNEKVTDEPFLNQRGQSLVGRTATLEEPIREGQGRIKLGDTFWTVEGPDLPTGTRVRVAASSGRTLVVEAV